MKRLSFSLKICILILLTCPLIAVDHQVYVQNQSTDTDIRADVRRTDGKVSSKVVHKNDKEWIHLGNNCMQTVSLTAVSGKYKGRSSQTVGPFTGECTDNLIINMVNGTPTFVNRSVKDPNPAAITKEIPALPAGHGILVTQLKIMPSVQYPVTPQPGIIYFYTVNGGNCQYMPIYMADGKTPATLQYIMQVIKTGIQANPNLGLWVPPCTTGTVPEIAEALKVLPTPAQ